MSPPSHGEEGYIDTAGNIVIPINFDIATPFHKGLACVSVGKQLGPSFWVGHNWGIIDRRGEFVLKPQFDHINDWSEGMAAVSKDALQVKPKSRDGYPHLWGFVDDTGRIAIAPRYESAGSFSEGLAAVLVPTGKNAKCGFHR